MDAAPDDDKLRLRFYERLADTELFLLLAGEPDGDQITPEIFDIADGRFVLVFDREARLSEFTGRIVPYAGLAGRTLVGMLAGQGIGLALNLQVAPSEMLIPAEALDWLASTLENAPEEAEARITEVTAPGGLPEDVVTGLDRKLATAPVPKALRSRRSSHWLLRLYPAREAPQFQRLPARSSSHDLRRGT